MAKQESSRIVTNADVKAERDSILALVGNFNARLEVAKSNVKKELEYLKNLKSDSEKNVKEVEKTKNKLAEAKGSLALVKENIKKESENLEALALKIEQEKKEAIDKAEKELTRFKARIKPVRDELEALDKGKIEKTKEFGRLSAINEDLEDNIEKLKKDKASKDFELKEVTNAIIKGSAIVKSLDPKKEEVKKAKLQLVEERKKLSIIKERGKDLENDSLSLLREIKELTIKKVKLASEIKKEEVILTNLRKQEQRINDREVELQKLEKRIKKMGDTLQKHFNDNGMKHIKVFK